jgi:hypothetical protein
MIVKKVDAGKECFNGYSFNDGILTVGGIAIDLQAEQGEQEVIITFCLCGGEVHRGMSAGGAYVVEVIIPPKNYELVEVAAVPSGGEGEEEMQTERVAIPLDFDTVSLTLWPIELGVETEEGVK